MSKLVVGSATDVGLVRSNNQDQFLIAPGLYAVADGMGGHAAGEVASSTAVQALVGAFQSAGQRSVAALEGAAKAANRAVWEQARSNRHMLGMGTTLVVLAVVERTDHTNGLAIAHIGDSRAYQVREGQIRQLTVDHSLVQELVDDGQITPAQATVHPQRHVLTRALGVEPNVVVDLLHVDAQYGDRYLLCSDGLPREATDEQIAAVMNRFEDPDEAAKELVALAKSRGGSDNITVVVVDVLSDDRGPSIEVPSHGTSTGTGALEPGAESSSGASVAPSITHGPAVPYQTDGNNHPTATTPTTDATAMLRGPGARGLSVTTLLEAPPAPLGTPPPSCQPAPRKAETASEGVVAPVRPRPAVGAHMATGTTRWLTWRVAAFFLTVCLVLGGAVAGIAWYARSTYYVQLDPPTPRGHITVFQGRPGGVLWFDPTVVERTRYTAGSVQSSFVPHLQAGVLESTLGAANTYVQRLVADEASARRALDKSAPPSNGAGPEQKRTASTTRGATPTSTRTGGSRGAAVTPTT